MADNVRGTGGASLPALVLATMAIGLGLAAALMLGGLRLVQVSTGSMEPTIRPQQWVLVAPSGRVARGDVIEFSYPSGTSGRAIKRVAAVAGDTVEFRTRSLVEGRSQAPTLSDRRLGTLTIRPGEVFLLGDAPRGSVDSRSFGPVTTSELTGRVLTTVPDPRLLLLLLALVVVSATLVGRAIAGSQPSGIHPSLSYAAGLGLRAPAPPSTAG